MHQVSMKLNFTYVVREPSDGQWGVVRGGQWNGLIRWSLIFMLLIFTLSVGIDQLSTFKSNMFYFNLILVSLIPHAQLLICKATLRLSGKWLTRRCCLGRLPSPCPGRECRLPPTIFISFCHPLFSGCQLYRPDWCAAVYIYVQVHFHNIFQKRESVQQITFSVGNIFGISISQTASWDISGRVVLCRSYTTLPSSVTCDHHLIGFSWSWYLAVFTPTVWGCIGLTMLIMGPILWMLHRTTPYYE